MIICFSTMGSHLKNLRIQYANAILFVTQFTLQTQTITHESCSTYRASRNTSFPLHEIFPCLLALLFPFMCLHTLWCRLVCRNSEELDFVKTRLKCKFGVNQQSFSHELCQYIMRFYLNERGGFCGARIGKTITAFIDQGD